MIARTAVFSNSGKLTSKDCQLVWDGKDGKHATMPIEDLGFVVLESKLIEISANLLQQLAANNVAVIVCDDTHTPSAQLIPFAAHSTTQEITEAQLAATEAVNKRIWRQICRAKIINQSRLLIALNHDKEAASLKQLAAEVKNGDPTNCEAQAARIYFQTLAPSPDFKRNPDGVWPNAALNYGYALLRAATARALISSGLICIRGIHHHNRYNAFCLADDIMEPYRPFIDQAVLSGIFPFDGQITELIPVLKRNLLSVLSCDVEILGKKSPLMVALSYTTASLAKYFLGKTEEIVLPCLST